MASSARDVMATDEGSGRLTAICRALERGGWNIEGTVLPTDGESGASRARTGDLLAASQTLSQLSYGPRNVTSVAP
jgi:hypothetical protein